MSFRTPHDEPSNLPWIRSAADLMIIFVIAVILLRGFVLEGYLISTGSMAPGLLGFHKHVVCPSCQYAFAFGVSFDDSVAPDQMESELTRRYATCPNCGQINIDVDNVPVSHGDQLLVQKHVYDFRRPHRWETIVFRNPASPGEAYVKRVVGLPGESIQVVDGEIFINGQLARKDYQTQRCMQIGVSDIHHLADSATWEMPWLIDSEWKLNDGILQVAASADSNSSMETDAVPSPFYEIDPTQPPNMHSITFRPWRWYGGRHFAETPLKLVDAEPDWQNFLERFDSLPVSWVSRIEYDAGNQLLRCEGVMPDEMQRSLTAEATNPAFRSAVYRLAALSHLCVVTDHYGYNAMVTSPEYPVNDLMLRTVMTWGIAPEEIHFEVPVDSEVFSLHLFPKSGQLELRDADGQVLRRATLDDMLVANRPGVAAGEAGLELELSNIDHQVTVAINQQVVMQPLTLPVPDLTDDHDDEFDQKPGTIVSDHTDITETPLMLGRSLKNSTNNLQRAAQTGLLRERQGRWKFSVRGGELRIQELQMYRDVYYTPGRGRNGVSEPYHIPADCYFVQGDNSPVSSDSRSWPDPRVPHRMLLGKPFLLHLPSRPAVLQLGKARWPIRVPDWSRIRYIQ